MFKFTYQVIQMCTYYKEDPFTFCDIYLSYLAKTNSDFASDLAALKMGKLQVGLKKEYHSNYVQYSSMQCC